VIPAERATNGGLLQFDARSLAPKFVIYEADSPKVSGRCREYSRFPVCRQRQQFFANANNVFYVTTLFFGHSLCEGPGQVPQPDGGGNTCILRQSGCYGISCRL
jgi:hypothetical protein